MASVAGSPVRPHSVSPKCTSLAVAIVARSRPAGCTSVRTRAGQPAVGRRAVDRERVLGVGGETGRPGRCGAARWSRPRRRRPASRPRRPASVRNVTTTSSGPDAHELGVAATAIGQARAAAADATGQSPRAPLQARAVGPQAGGAHPFVQRVVAVVVTDDRRLRATAMAARIAATSSGVASGDTERTAGRPRQSGTLPCLRGGSSSRFVRSIVERPRRAPARVSARVDHVVDVAALGRDVRVGEALGVLRRPARPAGPRGRRPARAPCGR